MSAAELLKRAYRIIMGFSIIPVEEIDIPFVDLQAQQPDIERFSASTLIFLCDLHKLHTAYVLLCQRALLGKDENGNDKENSWAFSWEPLGGSQEIFDKTILNTVRRKKKSTCTARAFLVRSTGIPGCIRGFRWPDIHFLWKSMSNSRSNERGATESSSPSCWVTEAQIRDSPSYDGKDPQHQRGLVMLESKKDMILDAFMRLKNSQLDMTYALSMD
ncbi:hypothetical protein PENNAL_c0227G05933 [Penicillium nalgiovense]|uniref:Uncharacterized protein n=1 Tax=Penicillium nalgiovense TaxID=60175 RepID=A0A1V6WNP7_PENNA|nr:hypothetical protein PENNAL_c0227G05933 [Penicillium nalgiovense]